MEAVIIPDVNLEMKAVKMAARAAKVAQKGNLKESNKMAARAAILLFAAYASEQKHGKEAILASMDVKDREAYLRVSQGNSKLLLRRSDLTRKEARKMPIWALGFSKEVTSLLWEHFPTVGSITRANYPGDENPVTPHYMELRRVLKPYVGGILLDK